MNIKTALIVVGILVALALGVYAFMDKEQSGPMDAKIDINAVCEGALAYMSFPNGAAAEVWVQECKNGEHPEAIEQYKLQMGITDDRAI